MRSKNKRTNVWQLNTTSLILVFIYFELRHCFWTFTYIMHSFLLVTILHFYLPEYLPVFLIGVFSLWCNFPCCSYRLLFVVMDVDDSFFAEKCADEDLEQLELRFIEVSFFTEMYFLCIFSSSYFLHSLSIESPVCPASENNAAPPSVIPRRLLDVSRRSTRDFRHPCGCCIRRRFARSSAWCWPILNPQAAKWGVTGGSGPQRTG